MRTSVIILLAVLAVARGLCADVTLTRLANEGVILSDGGSGRVMIDGMVVDPYSLYGGLPEEAAAQFFQASGPFAGIQLALASHQHHDHNQPTHACRFLQASTGTRFVSSSQVMDLMREKCRQFVSTSRRIEIIDPQYGHTTEMKLGDISISVFLLSHGVGKYARLQNFAHLVEMGGLRVLHLGDAAMDPVEFARAHVDEMDVDVALIPYWFFQPGPGGAIVRRFLNVPHQIAVHVPPAEMEEVKTYLEAEYPHVLVLENALDQVRFSPGDGDASQGAIAQPSP